MFKEDKRCDLEPEIDTKELERVIKEIVSSEVNSDGEESNPFKPVTIANWNTPNRS